MKNVLLFLIMMCLVACSNTPIVANSCGQVLDAEKDPKFVWQYVKNEAIYKRAYETCLTKKELERLNK